MKYVVQAVLGAALLATNPTFAATPPAPPAAATDAAHVHAVQDLLAAMQAEKLLIGVAARSHYQSVAQRQAVLARVGSVPPAEVYRRAAPPLASVISTDTALEMTRFYGTPYGKQVIHDKYNSRGGLDLPGMTQKMAPDEKKARARAAYVQASKQLAAAEPAIDHAMFVLLQQINQEKR